MTLLPEPDSPRRASTFPASSEKVTPFTARTMPSRVSKATLRSRTLRSSMREGSRWRRSYHRARTEPGCPHRRHAPSGLLGLQLRPARVEPVDLGPRGLQRGVALLERGRVGGDRRVLRLRAGRPRAALSASGWPAPCRPTRAARDSRGAAAAGARARRALARPRAAPARRGAGARLPLRVVGERRGAALAVEGEDHAWTRARA